MSVETVMNEIGPEIAKQSPALVVIALVSLGFLYLIFKYLKARDKEQQQLFHEAMLTIKENSKILGQVQSLFQHLMFASGRIHMPPNGGTEDEPEDTDKRTAPKPQ